MVLKNVAVTGAGGMIGRHLIALLLSRGVTVAASDLLLPDKPRRNIAWSSWDLAEWKTADELDEIFGRPDALFHVGALVPNSGDRHYVTRQKIFDANVRACLCLGEWALKNKIPIVFLSGATVYTDPGQCEIVESAPKSCCGFGGFYGASKWLAEQTFEHLVSEGLQRVVLRPSSVYGWGLGEQKMISRFLAIAAKDGVIELQPPEEEKINLIHAFDVAQAMVEALEQEAWGIFNIASTASHSVREIADACVKVVGRGKVKPPASYASQGALLRFNLSTQSACRAFGFSLSLDLHHGLEKMWCDMNKSSQTPISMGDNL